MPTLEENQHIWSRHDWSRAGEEWSQPWGGVAQQWVHTIYSRIHGLLPRRTILEIAPGYGRWTQFLLPFCERFYGIDMIEACVAHCRERFRGRRDAHFMANDGTSLAMIPDAGVDFVFSFDSLVHAEADVIEAYLRQLALKLAVGGLGFIHHSNFGALSAAERAAAAVPHWRAASMSAERFAALAAEAGLRCLAQEMVGWRQPVLIDCFSYFTREAPGAAADGTMLRRRNDRFTDEIKNAELLSHLYRAPAR